MFVHLSAECCNWGRVQICPEWERLTYHIEHNAEAKDKLGWVREMYAWSVGAALQVPHPPPRLPSSPPPPPFSPECSLSNACQLSSTRTGARFRS